MAFIKRIGKDKFGIPIWKVAYRRTPGGKQVMRHLHFRTREEAERAIQLDSQRSDIGLKWSEGAKIYLDAKVAEGVGRRSLENVRRAVRVLHDLMGDPAIEGTSAADFKEFMQAVAHKPMWNAKARGQKVSGPKVANVFRTRLLTLATYLLKHTSTITRIPFKDVPSLPVKAAVRQPIPRDKVNDYLESLPPYLRRPVQMVLYYGLRSTATCNLSESSIDGAALCAVDKGGVRRRIPIDPMLAGIIADARVYKDDLLRQCEERRRRNPSRKQLVPSDRLFVNARGRGWCRGSLLNAVQRAWNAAGLAKKNIHEVRHTLGTLASREFNPRMVQAAMGHRSEKSGSAYFHPDEDMAAEVRRKIMANILGHAPGTDSAGLNKPVVVFLGDGEYACPCCSAKVAIVKEKEGGLSAGPVPAVG